MMVEFEPPLVACVVSNGDYSFAAAGNEGVRDRHSGAEACVQGCGGGQLLGARCSQVREIRPTPGASRARDTASRGRVFRQSRMQGGRYLSGQQVQPLYS